MDGSDTLSERSSALVAERIHFELELQPETEARRWRAFLRVPGEASSQALEFASPLELVRHLAALGIPIKHRKRGLR